MYLKTQSTFANHELGSVGPVQTIYAVCPKNTILSKKERKRINRHLMLLQKLN